MVIGGIAILLGLVLEPLGRVVGWVAWLFPTFTIEMVRLTARIPMASLSVETKGWMVWGYCAVLGLATWWLGRPRERRRRVFDGLRTGLGDRLRERLSAHVEATLVVGAAAVLLALAVFAWRALPDGRLHVHVLDVGQGDAIFIRTPSGRQVLIGGEAQRAALAAGPADALLLPHARPDGARSAQRPLRTCYQQMDRIKPHWHAPAVERGSMCQGNRIWWAQRRLRDAEGPDGAKYICLGLVGARFFVAAAAALSALLRMTAEWELKSISNRPALCGHGLTTHSPCLEWFEVIWLPVRAPELKPLEVVWNHAK